MIYGKNKSFKNQKWERTELTSENNSMASSHEENMILANANQTQRIVLALLLLQHANLHKVTLNERKKDHKRELFDFSNK